MGKKKKPWRRVCCRAQERHSHELLEEEGARETCPPSPPPSPSRHFVRSPLRRSQVVTTRQSKSKFRFPLRFTSSTRFPTRKWRQRKEKFWSSSRRSFV